MEKKKPKNTIKSIILGSIIGILLGSVGLVSYAMFSYNYTGINNKLLVGDIYMRYKEGSSINLSGAMPSSTYPEKAANNYFEFQIIGKNTNTKGDIKYNIKLAYGDSIQGKDRIGDQYLLLKLVEVTNLGEQDETETVIVNDANFNSIPNALLYTATIEKNTTSEITKTYRVYARISENVVIGNTNQTYTQAEWNNLYASIKINADGGYDQPYTSVNLISDLKANKLTNNNSITETNNGETITYLSGCSKYYLDQSASRCTQDNIIDFNYVWYSGRMWRITSFNETTNTIKIITEQSQTAIAWHEDTNNGGSTAFAGSYMKQFLNDEFYDSLYNPTNFIDTSVLWDITTTASASTKLSNPTITSNVGLLNSYEYYQSYQKVGSSNKYGFGYLNIGQYWWLLNPYSASGVWLVDPSGSNMGSGNPASTLVARPSINLKSSVNFTGLGTETDPYKIVGDKDIGTINTKLNTRTIGEYVKLKSNENEQVFRIVGFENNTTKLIQLDYVKKNGTNVTKKFATSYDSSSGNGTIFGEGNTVDDTNNTTWYSYLKNVYISNLETTYGSNLFTTGEYYLGINADSPSNSTTYYNYRTSICAGASDLTKDCTKSRSKTLEVGLLRYGEMFATQHGIGYNPNTSSYNTAYMWLMTRKNASYVWIVYYDGSVGARSFYDPTNTLVGRPSINLSSDVKILSGTGLPNDPYVVGL